MEKISLKQWNSYKGVDLPDGSVTTKSEMYYSDLMCSTVTVVIKSLHSLQTSKSSFLLGWSQEWMFKFFHYGALRSNCYSCGFSLLNTPNEIPAIISSIHVSACSMEYFKFIRPAEVWGFINIRADSLSASNQFYFAMKVLEKVPLIIVKSVEQIEDEEKTSEEIKAPDNSKLLFTDGDITLVGTDWELRCHKQVLTDKSPVFKAMFDHDMVESRTSRVEIKDTTCPVMQAMLVFMYTDEPVTLSKNINEITCAAVKYQIEDLKIHCINHMISNLSVENAVDFMFLCDICDSEELRKCLVSFVQLNIENIVLTDGWQQVEKLSNTFSTLIKAQAFL